MYEISVLILAKNEEKNIFDCINSCSFASEIIVIDDFSTDKTREIAKNLGAKVIQRAMNGDWGVQQTFAIQQAKMSWIFFIDADERVTPELANEMIQAVKKGDQYGYWIKRINHFNHKLVKYGSLRPDWVCRLMPTKGSYVDGLVHPKIIHQYSNKKLKAKMLHFTYDNWQQYFNKLNNYTTLAANKYYKEGKRANFFLDIILRPVFAFFKIYILQLGILDGKLGFVLGQFHYTYTLAKYIKLYYLEQEKMERNL